MCFYVVSQYPSGCNRSGKRPNGLEPWTVTKTGYTRPSRKRPRSGRGETVGTMCGLGKGAARRPRPRAFIVG